MVENNSSFSKALPVPTATQDKGSSAIVTGNPVSLEINLSMFLNNAPPPVRTNPISTKSADNSGGVFSKAFWCPRSNISTFHQKSVRSSRYCCSDFFLYFFSSGVPN